MKIHVKTSKSILKNVYSTNISHDFFREHSFILSHAIYLDLQAAT